MPDLDAATRARLDEAADVEGGYDLDHANDLRALLAAYDALRVAQAQAAPVLAAAEEWRRLRFREAGMDAAATLDEAVVAWFAARSPEGSRE